MLLYGFKCQRNFILVHAGSVFSPTLKESQTELVSPHNTKEWCNILQKTNLAKIYNPYLNVSPCEVLNILHRQNALKSSLAIRCVRMDLIFGVSETCGLVGGYQCFGMNLSSPYLGSSQILVTTFKTAGLLRHNP